MLYLMDSDLTAYIGEFESGTPAGSYRCKKGCVISPDEPCQCCGQCRQSADQPQATLLQRTSGSAGLCVSFHAGPPRGASRATRLTALDTQ